MVRGITIRAGDAEAEAGLAALRDVRTAACTSAERAALHALGAGCHAPVGALAVVEDGRIRLRVRVLSRDGSQTVEGEAEGPLAAAIETGKELAAELLERGAGPLVQAQAP